MVRQSQEQVKYHINTRGDAGICTATVGVCPFGSESDHYVSAEAAYASKYNNLPSASKKKIQAIIEEEKSLLDENEELYSELDDAQAMREFLPGTKEMDGHASTASESMFKTVFMPAALALDVVSYPIRLAVAAKREQAFKERSAPKIEENNRKIDDARARIRDILNGSEADAEDYFEETFKR